MRSAFVKTSNVLAFENALSALKKRGAAEACLVVVDGAPGLGKTTSLSRFAAHNACIYLRAKKEWTPSWFLNELLREMRQQPPHAFERKYEATLKVLAHRQNQAIVADKTFALIIDEADHISSKPSIMETVRDLSDMLEMPVILVGMGKIRNNLTRYPQIASRISQYVGFERATEDDVKKFFEELCEVPVAEDLIKFAHRVTDGYNREIKEAIAFVERFGKRNKPGANGLTLRDMAGEHIVNDRRTGQPIRIPVQP